MTWKDLDNSSYSAPYRVYGTIRGWDAWLYGKEAGLLQKGFKTRIQAKAYCELHKAKKV